MNFVYNHLHFRSEDPDAAAKFYCDNFGAIITAERPLSNTKSIQLALNGDTTDSQREHAWAEASFALAEIAIRDGDAERARHFLEQAASSKIEFCEARKLAMVWLPRYMTSAKDPLTP